MTEPLGTFSGFEVEDLGELTVAGVTDSVLCGGVNVTFQVKLASVGTNVVIRLEGSLNNTDFFNLAASNADYTLTANGTYGYVLFAPVKYIRLRLVSLSGGTPTVSAIAGAA